MYEANWKQKDIAAALGVTEGAVSQWMNKEVDMTDSEKFHVPPSAVLRGYFQGQWIARCIHLAAILDLAGYLKNGPKSIQDLAEATETHAPSLYRLLRALASLGIFTEI